MVRDVIFLQLVTRIAAGLENQRKARLLIGVKWIALNLQNIVTLA